MDQITDLMHPDNLFSSPCQALGYSRISAEEAAMQHLNDVEFLGHGRLSYLGYPGWPFLPGLES